MSFQIGSMNVTGGTFNNAGRDQYNIYLSEEDKFQALLRVLDLVNYKDDFTKHSETRLEGTCEWSLRHPRISAWLDSSDAFRLWVYGNPGTGKSTLSAYLIDQERRRASSNDLVLYFFGDNKRQDTGKQSSVLILKVLLAQLVKTSIDEHTLHLITEDVLSKGPNYRFAVRDLTGHLISALKAFRRICFIIDALDECDMDITDKGGLLDVLQTLPIPDVKILLLSRKEEHIQRRLDDWPQMAIGSGSTTQDDIQMYVRDQVSELKRRVPRIPFSEEELRCLLLESAGNMFLYVRLMVQNLIENSSLSSEDLKLILTNCPKDLDNMYEQYILTFHRRNDERRNRLAVRALQMVIYSQAPLTLTMLNMALAIEPGDEDLHPGKLHGNVEAVLRQTLGILVDCRKLRDFYDWHPVHAVPVHQSLKDFLLRLNQPSRPVPPELHILRDSMDSQSAHAEFMRIFCTLMCSPIARMQLKSCQDTTDEYWQERRTWWRRLHAMDTQERKREWQEETRRFKARKLDVKRELKRVLRPERALTEQLIYDDLLELIQFLSLYRPDVLLYQDTSSGEQDVTTKTDLDGSWLHLWVALASRAVLQVPSRLQGSHEIWVLRELELTMYMRRHFPSHLAGIGGLRSDHPVYEKYLNLLRTSLEMVAGSGSELASDLDISETRSRHDVAAAVELSLALRSLPDVIARVQCILSPGYGEDSSARSYSLEGAVRLITQSINAHSSPTPSAFGEIVTQSVDSVKSPLERKRLQKILASISIAIWQLREIESSFLRSQQRMPITIGATTLLYGVHTTMHNLARWMVLSICIHLPECKDLRERVVRGDFLESETLFDVGDRVHPMNFDTIDDARQVSLNQSLNSNGNGVVLINARLWGQYPFYFCLSWLAAIFTGALNLLPTWTLVMFIFISSRLHHHKTTVLRELMLSSSVLLFTGQLLSILFRIGFLPFTLGLGGVGFGLYLAQTTRVGLVQSRDGVAYLNVDSFDSRVSRIASAFIARMLSIDRTIHCTALWIEIRPSVLAIISVNTLLNSITAFCIAHELLVWAIDPTGLRRATRLLKELPVLFEQSCLDLVQSYRAHYNRQLPHRPRTKLFWPPPSDYAMTTGTSDSFLGPWDSMSSEYTS